jgi:hypothetical protein
MVCRFGFHNNEISLSSTNRRLAVFVEQVVGRLDEQCFEVLYLAILSYTQRSTFG